MGVRSFAALKLFATIAIFGAAVLLVSRRSERDHVAPRRVNRGVPKGTTLFAPGLRGRRRAALVLAASLALVLAGSLLVASLTGSDDRGDGGFDRAALAPLSGLSAGPAEAAEAAPYVPAGANAYWYARAKEIGKGHLLGDLFVRQMMQESGFRDDVITGATVSFAGAEGIAQIMREHHPSVDPLNPEAALNYAAQHMLNLLMYYEGNIMKALAAYNAGPGTVDWAESFAGDQWLQWVPWETQDYISSVMLSIEPAVMPNWSMMKRWWARMTERIERRLQLRLLYGPMISIDALPRPHPRSLHFAGLSEAVPAPAVAASGKP